MQHVTIKETRAIDHVLVNRLERGARTRAKLRMRRATTELHERRVSAAGAAPLASSMSSPQLGLQLLLSSIGKPIGGCCCCCYRWRAGVASCCRENSSLFSGARGARAV